MIGIQRLAEMMDVTPRHCQRLVAEGMPRAKRGQYDEVACLSWYVRYLQAKMRAGAADPTADDPGGGSNTSARERLDDAKASLAEYDLAEKRRQVLTVGDWERAMSEILTPARHELLAIPSRLRPVIGSPAAAKVEEEIQRALRAFVGREDEVAS